jgi:hypothetical protein
MAGFSLVTPAGLLLGARPDDVLCANCARADAAPQAIAARSSSTISSTVRGPSLEGCGAVLGVEPREKSVRTRKE